MKRHIRLPKKSKSESALLKDDIQAMVRAIVIARDKGCILKNHRLSHDTVLQADHLISRSNSATYADTRLIVCLCRACHGWKSLGNNLRKSEYDTLVKTILTPDRVALWEKAERNSWKPTKMNWKLELCALKQELALLTGEN